jgi:histone acetyltransferase (RNA polymerase elongator complex component)
MLAVKAAGFDLIGQMMVGLPRSPLKDELDTLKGICDCKADGARIYPTVVFHKTELYDMMLLGKYDPISPQEASERVAELLYLAHENSLPVIRVGLCESESLHSEDGLTAGAFHPALGEICFSAFFLKLFRAHLDTLGDLSGRSLTVSVARNMLSKAIGQKRSNAVFLKENYSLSKISFATDENLSGYEFLIS